MILMAQSLGVARHIVLIVAGLASEQLFMNNTDTTGSYAESKRLHAKWFCDKSDALGYLRVLGAFLASDMDQATFAETYALSQKALRESCDLVSQLWSILGHDKRTAATEFATMTYPTEKDETRVLKCIVAGFIDQVAMREDDPNELKADRKKVRYVNCGPIDVNL
jgi:hypothetical protein